MNLPNSVVAKQQINIKVDLVHGWVNEKAIELKQADHKTRFFMIRVSNILPINIEGCVPTVFFKQPNGETYDTLGKVVNANKGEFMVELTSTLLKGVGNNQCEIVLLKDGEAILSFPHFYFKVTESYHDDESSTITEEELSIFWGLINQANNALAQMGKNYASFEGQKEGEFQDFLAQKETQMEEFISEKEAQVESFKNQKSQEFQEFINTKETQVEDFIAQKELELNQSESARQSSETSREENEEGRINAETLRQEAENMRQQNFVIMEEKVDKIYNSTITLLYEIVE